MKLFYLLSFLLLSLNVNLYAQNNVIKFLGIPIDGYKSEMIKKLKNKGYTSSPYNKDVLTGEFNGRDANIFIVTNNNKVWRIMVAFQTPVDESSIKIDYNNLITQFRNNKNYLPLPDSTLSQMIIPEDENISYELTIHKKSYQAVFYQKNANFDSLVNLQQKYIANNDSTMVDNVNSQMRESIRNSVLYNQVWFAIYEDENIGKYRINIYYDNRYNGANGEDL